MLVALLMMAAGIALLYLGAEGLVRGSCGIAAWMGISPLIVGVTVVALGTSMPEVITSVLAHVGQGKSDIAMGNVIGSNIANIALVLGLSATLHPIDISEQARKREMPIMLLVTVIFVGIMALGTITQLAGAFLLAGIFAYMGYQIYLAKQHRLSKNRMEILEEETKEATPHYSLNTDLLMIFAGLLGLVFGGHILVTGAVNAAELLGISERIIALTIVAAGTSCPEVATSLLAAYRTQHDISVGNIIGSNIFNILLVIGLCAVILPMKVSADMLHVDAMVMLALAAVMTGVAFWAKRFGRSVGIALLASYVGYLTFLVMS